MFGIGWGELLVIALVLLVVVGPDKMPAFLKTTVKGIRDFRRTARELRDATGIDRILDDRPPPPKRVTKLSEYEVSREVPVIGADLEFARSSAVEREDEWAQEVPLPSADILFAQHAGRPAVADPGSVG